MPAPPPPPAATGDLEITCQTCGARIVVEARLRTAECPYCASHSVVERPPSPDRPEPAFVLAFTVERERASARLGAWLKSRGLFAHSGLKQAVVGSTRGVYLPAYLYGARARADYRAQIGENYTETETYTTTDSKGKSVTRTRTVVKTEWRSLSGLRDSYVLDVVVTASRGVPNQELEAIEPFDLRALRRYSPALLSGWIAEEPSLLREQCVAQAHGEAEDGIGRELDGFMPGDSHRALEYRVAVEDETADLVLLPLWVFAVRYAEDKPPVRILLNGQTGSIGGRVPLSAIKITLAILFVLTLVAALVLVLSRS